MTDTVDNEIWTGADLRAVAAVLHVSPEGAIPALAGTPRARPSAGGPLGFRHDVNTRCRRRADPRPSVSASMPAASASASTFSLHRVQRGNGRAV